MKTKLLSRLLPSHTHTFTALAIAGLALSLTPLTRGATTDFVLNGSFNGPTTSSQMRSQGPDTNLPSTNCTAGASSENPSGPCATMPDWHTNGLTFVYTSRVISQTTGARTVSGAAESPWRLWGPLTAPPSNNGFTMDSPNGGNFIALDSDRVSSFSGANSRIQGSVSQVITGLTAGENATLTFEWAAAQGGAPLIMGPTNDQILATLCPVSSGASLSNPRGGCGPLPSLMPPGAAAGHEQPTEPGVKVGNGQTTDLVAIPSHGFKGWMTETFTFDPAGTAGQKGNYVLSFLAQGNPSGEPPMVLLDGVALNQQVTPPPPVIPEPGTWLMIGIGLAFIAGFAYRHPEWLCAPAQNGNA